jgi:uncharacterized protein
MNPSLAFLTINVGFLMPQAVGSFRDMQFDADHARFSPDLDVAGLHGTLRVNRAREGLLLDGNFSAQLDMQCVRCLTTFGQNLNAHFEELYAFKNHPISQSGLIVPDSGKIDLAPLVEEYLKLEIPIKPLCKPDCQGLCPICGADLNVAACEHHVIVSLV